MIKHTDSGHGWLQVKKEALKIFNIEHLISSFSYEDGEFVYLEEDCDAPLFLEHLYGQKEWWNNEKHKAHYRAIPNYNYDGDAPCRNYNSYGWKVKVYS
jgi:hypothetical protein